MSKLRKLIDLLKVAGRGKRLGGLQLRDAAAAIIDERLGPKFMAFYDTLTDEKEKSSFFLQVADELGPDVHAVAEKADKLKTDYLNPSKTSLVPSSMAELASACTPRYVEAIQVIGQAEGGIRFLARLRSDLLNLLHHSPPSSSSAAAGLRFLSDHLKQSLIQWFSPGLLSMVRLTWMGCSAEMLEKVMEGEKVHPIKGWEDLKRRLDERDRRAFAFLHPCLGPHEPLVILHCALAVPCPSPSNSSEAEESSSDHLPAEASSVQAILASRPFTSTSEESLLEHPSFSPPTPPPTLAVFYSISSTQPGLRGVSIGHHLILKAAKDIMRENPTINLIMTLSPIPGFRPWLIHKLSLEAKSAKSSFISTDDRSLLSDLTKRKYITEPSSITSERVSSCAKLLALLSAPDPDLISLRPLLMRLASRYLIREKRRGSALCSVANFHLSNGAMVMRLVWDGDTSSSATKESFGIMVNYRYEITKVHDRIRSYVANKIICASDEVELLVK